jgi:hypothetical protein
LLEGETLRIGTQVRLTVLEISDDEVLLEIIVHMEDRPLDDVQPEPE